VPPLKKDDGAWRPIPVPIPTGPFAFIQFLVPPNNDDTQKSWLKCRLFGWIMYEWMDGLEEHKHKH
jgi:hypothetical protein